MIIVVGGIKGGSGKTTAATNLAVFRAAQGCDVLLVDADDQESSYSFAQVRSETKPASSFSCIKLTGTPVGRECRKLSGKYQDIIIDVGGRDTASQRSALSVADIALVPFKPRSLDVWTLGQAAQMISEAKGVNDRLFARPFLTWPTRVELITGKRRKYWKRLRPLCSRRCRWATARRSATPRLTAFQSPN